ncbi:MAG: RNA polymerase sigma factor [Bacteroidales bacterium]|nr:RNA polymerase sigma factor [Bacteroidales bacterium]
MQRFSDEKLIQIFRNTNGNQRSKAFDCLYLRHVENLRNYFFFALGRDNEKANDFAHDLFVKILESPEKFDASQLFKPWIFRIASNMCKNEYRKQEVVNKYVNHVQQTNPVTTALRENEIRLRECLKKLSPEHRSLIVLRFKIKLSIKEMAEIYTIPEGTVKSRLFYATRELSNFYKE